MTQAASPQRSSKEQFDKQAAEYNAQWNEWSKETTQWLLSRSDAKSGHVVLDVATGTGFTALAFAPSVNRVIAVDVSEGMLAEARSRADKAQVANVEFLVAPAESLPFDDDSFDLIVCRIAAHHFLDVRAFLAESYRTLKPGGRLLIADTTVPDQPSEAAAWQNKVEAVRDPSHVRNYSPGEWRSFLSEARFLARDCTTSGQGITIPLSDWIRKAGCSAEQETEIRRAFIDAPQSARLAYKIQNAAAEAISQFTWQRVLIRADKAA